MGLELAKERKGGPASGLLRREGRDEWIGAESVNVVEDHVGTDVVERGGHDGLELVGHSVDGFAVAVTKGDGHVVRWVKPVMTMTRTLFK